jgi:hypothetical protein
VSPFVTAGDCLPKLSRTPAVREWLTVFLNIPLTEYGDETMQALLVAVLALANAGDMDSNHQPEAVAKTAQAKPFQLMSAKKEARLRKLLPKVADVHVQAMFDDERLLLYTESEMPRVYQLWAGDLQGVHYADYNISANSGEPFGNGNLEFPWNGPAGTHRSPDVKAFRFLYLPTDENGKVLPVVWYRKYLRGDSSEGYGWTYPLGTVFGEVLYVKCPDGFSRTFEVRTRTRMTNDWDVDVFRPFPTADDLARRIKELRPDWAERKNLVKVVEHLEQPRALPYRKLEDDHPSPAFSQKAGVDELPDLGDDALVNELLSNTVFTSVLGKKWREGTNGVKSFAPTTLASYHVVPKNYDAGFIEIDSASCMRCHKTTNQSVDRFDGGRDWYGRIRGSDGIFSFHPFEPATVSGNGFGSRPSMRDSLISAGLLQRFSAKKHPNRLYQKITTLAE